MRKLRSRLWFDLWLEVILLGEFDTRPLIEYNNGTQMNEVGAIMGEYKRNYAREAETAKARGETRVSIKVTKQVLEDFKKQCEKNGTTRNAVITKYIERYTYEGFDQW